MITFAMFGAAGSARSTPPTSPSEGARLAYIVDVDRAAMDHIAKLTGARPQATREEVLADRSVDAVVIASPTDTHAEPASPPPRPARRSSAKSRSTCR